MRRPALSLAVLGATLVAYWLVAPPTGSSPPSAPATARSTAKVMREPLTVWATYLGRLEPKSPVVVMSWFRGNSTVVELAAEGARVSKGDVLARTKGIFGKFRQEYKSDAAGTIESISAVTGQVILRGAPLPVQVRAYLKGRVVDIVPNEGCAIEADVTFVQGIFGVGGETFGPIRMVCKTHDQEFAEDLVTPALKDCVAVGGARVTAQAIERARKIGVAAIVSGGKCSAKCASTGARSSPSSMKPIR